MSEICKTFMEDPSNTRALAACKEASGNSADFPNLLWLYGQTGCGKTHLLDSVFHVLKLERRKDVVFLSANVLAKALVENKFKENNSEAWTCVKNADVLIVDNMEYLQNKTTTQSEIARLFLDRLSKYKQVILASACHPNELPVLANDLREVLKTARLEQVRRPSNELKKKYIDNYIVQNPWLKTFMTEESKRCLAIRAKTIPELDKILQAEWRLSL